VNAPISVGGVQIGVTLTTVMNFDVNVIYARFGSTNFNWFEFSSYLDDCEGFRSGAVGNGCHYIAFGIGSVRKRWQLRTKKENGLTQGNSKLFCFIQDQAKYKISLAIDGTIVFLQMR